MSKASDNVFPRFLISEGGSTATPASGRVTVYAKANGLLYSKDDAGAETALGGSAASFVGVRAYNQAGQTVSTEATLTFASEQYDTSTMHDTATNTERLTIPTTGYWRVGYRLIFIGNSGAFYAYLRADGTTTLLGTEIDRTSTTDHTIALSTVLYLTSGQYIEIRAFRTTSGAIGYNSTGSASIFEAHYIAA